MPVDSHYVLQALDAKEAALALLLKKGNKRVLWDSCELIWDPYELLGQRAKKQNQLAVYGVTGIIESRAHKHYNFQLRYNVDYNRPRYRVNVTIMEVGGRGEFYEQEYVTMGLFLESVHRQYLVDRVIGLTDQQAKIGPDATIRSFLTPDPRSP